MAFLYYHATLNEEQQWMENPSRDIFLAACQEIAKGLREVEPFALIRTSKENVSREIFKNRDPDAVFTYDTITTLVTMPKGIINENWGILATIYENGKNPQELRRMLALAFQQSITGILTTSSIGPIIRIQATAYLRIKIKWHVLPNTPEEYCFIKSLRDLEDEYKQSIQEGLEKVIVGDNLDEEDMSM
ncbi:hypothetical protein HY483_03070 [Candidatus Woesearchaeota archaeon]|nr:hypothetical protein [Candidatus Woesearchaeota archaeon]